ncbi:MAG: leucine-rich repeat protein [Clostridia bacterium]|nr:leucine-rich repeat protein [Clostridia bacterium]
MKKILSVALVLVIAFGIFTSVPITANAASVSDLTFVLDRDNEIYYVTDCADGATGEIVIPGTYNDLPVMYIDDYAFSGCKALTSVTISDGVTHIGEHVFEGCTSLTSVTIPNSVKSIGVCAFMDCTSLTSITIPNSIKSIGGSVFFNCASLTSVAIPDSVTSIGGYVFSNCTSLTSIAIPDSVTRMGNSVFSNCTSLTSVAIPDSVTHMGDSVFSDCTSLTSVTIPDRVKSISLWTFSGCTSLTSITIPDSVTSIEDWAFEDCTSLTSVTIPDSVTSIGDEVFDDCTSLTSVTIPDSVLSIGYKAFGYTFSLEENKECKVKDFTIYGVKKTEAESYAVNNGFKFVALPGTLAVPKIVDISKLSEGIKIEWDKIDDAQKYIVYKRVYDETTKKWSGWKVIKTTANLEFLDTSVKITEKYRYTVKAVNETSTSKYKSTGTITYSVVPIVKAANVSNGIKITWQKIVNVTGYTVYSSTYNTKTKKWSGWKNRGTVGKNTTSWVDKSAKAGTYYRYTVRARCGSAASSYVASKNVLRLLSPKVNVAKASNGIKVNWSKVAGAKSYRIYRTQYVNGKWSGWKLLETSEKKFILTDKTAKKGVYYKYTVKAVNGSNMSAYTASGKIKR